MGKAGKKTIVKAALTLASRSRAYQTVAPLGSLGTDTSADDDVDINEHNPDLTTVNCWICI
jgi:hypothetical protein